MATRGAPRAAGGRNAGGPPAKFRDRLDSKRSSRLLGALADPERLRIVQCLENGPCSVSDISRALKSPLANTSHHLQLLRHAGLVRPKRQGRHMLYSLSPALFRPPAGDAPAVLDFGSCRVELDVAGKRPKRRKGTAAATPVDDKFPQVTGIWIGQWEPSSAGGASVARGAGRTEIACVVELAGGTWHATFEGESGHAYKYSVAMEGRREGDAVLFKGSTDLGQQGGGVFDWIGRAAEGQFAGFYTSAYFTGTFSLRRVRAD